MSLIEYLFEHFIWLEIMEVILSYVVQTAQ